MTIEIPLISVYYYECSNAKFRLTLFIPKIVLARYIDDKMINQSVLIDFPDGCEIDCTEPDFTDFESQYQFRPKYSANLLCKSFESIWTSTYKWKIYKGTGLIAAKYLELNAKRIKDELLSEPQLLSKTVLKTESILPENKIKHLNKKRKISRAMESFIHNRKQVDIVENKVLGDQKFPKIAMANKDSANIFFNHINKNY